MVTLKSATQAYKAVYTLYDVFPSTILKTFISGKYYKEVSL